MIKNKLILTITTAALFCTAMTVNLTSCKKEKEEIISDKPEEVKIEKTSHSWYYFSEDNFNKIDKPQNAPGRSPQPWTETVRISSASTGSPSEDSMTEGKAYAIVNRLGVLCFEGNNITLAPDNNIFSNRTAGNLVFSNNVPVFSVYKSSFFNDTIAAPEYTEDSTAHLFLVQFDPLAKISYPLINSTSLVDNSNSEVTDFMWDNNKWYCTVKTIEDYKNEFSYLTWKTQIPLLSLSPAKAKENIVISPISSDDFRKAKSQIEYENAPERIKNLLAGFSKDLPFTLEVKTAGGPSPRLYVNKVKDSTEKELTGKGIISQSWSAVLFEDGTLFLEGALPGKHILRQGKPIAIRLPKLPAGYVYSEFTISDTTLYAAWEESSFYKTGRSGFIQVDHNETLYSKLI